MDADFAADLDTRRSHTGYVIMMNGGPISWKSVKQKSVSLSTAESEWYAASEASKELLYLGIIMREFGFPQLGPMYLYEDSRAVIPMAENPSNRKGARHPRSQTRFLLLYGDIPSSYSSRIRRVTSMTLNLWLNGHNHDTVFVGINAAFSVCIKGHKGERSI